MKLFFEGLTLRSVMARSRGAKDAVTTSSAASTKLIRDWLKKILSEKLGSYVQNVELVEDDKTVNTL